MLFFIGRSTYDIYINDNSVGSVYLKPILISLGNFLCNIELYIYSGKIFVSSLHRGQTPAKNLSGLATTCSIVINVHFSISNYMLLGLFGCLLRINETKRENWQLTQTSFYHRITDTSNILGQMDLRVINSTSNVTEVKKCTPHVFLSKTISQVVRKTFKHRW